MKRYVLLVLLALLVTFVGSCAQPQPTPTPTPTASPTAEPAQCLFPGPVYAAGDEPYSVAAADLDGDSYLDLAVANNRSDTVSVLLNRGNGIFQRTMPQGTGPSRWPSPT